MSNPLGPAYSLSAFMFKRNAHKYTNNIFNAENNPMRLHPAGQPGRQLWESEALGGDAGREQRWGAGNVGIIFGASVICSCNGNVFVNF